MTGNTPRIRGKFKRWKRWQTVPEQAQVRRELYLEILFHPRDCLRIRLDTLRQRVYELLRHLPRLSGVHRCPLLVPRRQLQKALPKRSGVAPRPRCRRGDLAQRDREKRRERTRRVNVRACVKLLTLEASKAKGRRPNRSGAVGVPVIPTLPNCSANVAAATAVCSSSCWYLLAALCSSSNAGAPAFRFSKV